MRGAGKAGIKQARRYARRARPGLKPPGYVNEAHEGLPYYRAAGEWRTALYNIHRSLACCVGLISLVEASFL